MIQQIFQQYQFPRNVIDYLLSDGDQEIPEYHYHRYEKVFTELYQHNQSDQFILNHLNFMAKNLPFDLDEVVYVLLDHGKTFIDILPMLEQLEKPIMIFLGHLIIEGGYRYNGKQTDFWDQQLDHLATMFTPERTKRYLDEWSENGLRRDDLCLLRILIRRGVDIPQSFLEAQVLNHSILDDEMLKIARLVDNVDLVYTHFITEVPPYLKWMKIDQHLIDDATKWLDGERSKTIDKSLKKICKKIDDSGYYWNFQYHFFFKMKFTPEIEPFNRLIKFGLLINPYKMLNYLRGPLSPAKISENYAVPEEIWGKYIASYRRYNSATPLLKHLLTGNLKKLFKGVVTGHSDGIRSLIPDIVNIDCDAGYQLLELLTTKGQKLSNEKLRNTIITHLKTYPEGIELARGMAQSPKKSTRLAGVLLLIQYNENDDLPLLNSILRTETDRKIIDPLKLYLK